MIDFDSIYQHFVYYNCKLNKKGRIGSFLSIVNGALIRLIYPCDISAYATIGKNLKIPHAIGIIIGATAIIADNVTIVPNVIIGSKFGRACNNNRRHAFIEKGCIIGGNTSIIGDVIIGENSIIGAGSTITKNVPPYSVVINNNQFINKIQRTSIEV